MTTADDSPSVERPVYVVTSGCYSDYHVSAVFDNYEAAKAFVGDDDDSDGCGSRVERYTLNSAAPRAMTYWEVSVVETASDGRALWKPGEYEHETSDWLNTTQRYPYARCASERTTKYGLYAATYYAIAVHPDRDTARKIAQDLLAQLKYEHQTNGITSLPVEENA